LDHAASTRKKSASGRNITFAVEVVVDKMPEDLDQDHRHQGKDQFNSQIYPGSIGVNRSDQEEQYAAQKELRTKKLNEIHQAFFQHAGRSPFQYFSKDNIGGIISRHCILVQPSQIVT
jgi:hypothetical protein